MKKTLFTAALFLVLGAAFFAVPATAQTRIALSADGVTLTGVLNDTAVAQEFAASLPQTVRLVRYADREYYGGIRGTIRADGERKRTFSKGEISYCPANNTLALWFDKDEQMLGMDIIKIGEITSDYSALRPLPAAITLTVRADADAEKRSFRQAQ